MNKKVQINLIVELFLILLLLAAGSYLGYKYGYKKGLKTKKREHLIYKTERLEKKIVPEISKQVIPEQEKKKKIEKLIVSRLSCKKLQQNILDFLSYLDKKEYIKKHCKNKDIKSKISSIIQKLSKNPPVPIGESIRNDIMIKNIYHFFRILSFDDIQMIKEILKNESNELEYIMRWYYMWLVQKDKCPDPYRLTPSMNIAYKYAAFFLNTIGGMSYLFRRSNQIRLLITYYSILIIYKMDMEEKNRYGINIVPIIHKLKEELEKFSELKFQDYYITTLNKIENYYYIKGRS